MSRLRAVAIITAFLAVTLMGMPFQWLLLKLKSPAARTFPHRYHRLVAAIFGIHIHVVVKPVTGEGVLLVANHTSWADIVIFSGVTPLSFVVKPEVRDWPCYHHPTLLQRSVCIG